MPRRQGLFSQKEDTSLLSPTSAVIKMLPEIAIIIVTLVVNWKFLHYLKREIRRERDVYYHLAVKASSLSSVAFVSLDGLCVPVKRWSKCYFE